MSTVFLFLVLQLFGQEPRRVMVPMPNLETCLQQAQSILNAPPDELMTAGGHFQASCVIHVEPRRA